MAEQFIVPLYRLELVREKNVPYQSVNKIEAAAEIFHSMLDSANVEKMAAIHCNSGLDMIGAEIIAIGSMNSVTAAMVDLYRGAIKNNASFIWMAHNHVDGRVSPSMPDYRYTRLAMDAGELLGLPLYDHLVIAPGIHYSMFEHREEFGKMVRLLDIEDMRNAIAKSVKLPGFNP